MPWGNLLLIGTSFKRILIRNRFTWDSRQEWNHVGIDAKSNGLDPTKGRQKMVKIKERREENERRNKKG